VAYSLNSLVVNAAAIAGQYRSWLRADQYFELAEFVTAQRLVICPTYFTGC